MTCGCWLLDLNCRRDNFFFFFCILFYFIFFILDILFIFCWLVKNLVHGLKVLLFIL